MRTLFAQLTQNDEGLPPHSLICEAHYCAHNSGDNNIEIVPDKSRFLTVRVTGAAGELLVLLRPLRRPLTVREVPFKIEERYNLSFTKKEILDFITAIGDNNPIHQLPPYVVPGLLVLETLWNRYQSKTDKRSISIVFHNATIVGDQIRLVFDEANYSIEGYGGEALLFFGRF